MENIPHTHFQRDASTCNPVHLSGQRQREGRTLVEGIALIVKGDRYALWWPWARSILDKDYMVLICTILILGGHNPFP